MKLLESAEAYAAKWSSELLSVFRIITAFLFMQHGGQKLFSFPLPPRGGATDLLSLDGLAGVMEFWLGLLFLVGVFTQLLAFLFCGLMAFAYFMVHAPRGFWPLANGGDLAVLFCFAFLYFSAAGGGAWSLDHVLRTRRKVLNSETRFAAGSQP